MDTPREMRLAVSLEVGIGKEGGKQGAFIALTRSDPGSWGAGWARRMAATSAVSYTGTRRHVQQVG